MYGIGNHVLVKVSAKSDGLIPVGTIRFHVYDGEWSVFHCNPQLLGLGH